MLLTYRLSCNNKGTLKYSVLNKIQTRLFFMLRPKRKMRVGVSFTILNMYLLSLGPMLLPFPARGRIYHRQAASLQVGDSLDIACTIFAHIFDLNSVTCSHLAFWGIESLAQDPCFQQKPGRSRSSFKINKGNYMIGGVQQQSLRN